MKFRWFGNSETQRKLEFSSFHHVSEIRKLEFLSPANWKFRCVPRICFVVKVALSSLPLSSSRVQLFFSLNLVHPSRCCHFDTEIIDRDTTLVKVLIGYDNPQAHWVHEQRCGQREQLCALRTLLRYNRSMDPFRNYIAQIFVSGPIKYR